MSSDMTLSEELEWRGFVSQTTFEHIRELDGKKWTFYHGFDASADSLTIGNLAGVMVDKVFLRHGCKAYVLAGGATSLIGDPGGKDTERPLQDEAAIAHNAAGVAAQLKKVLSGYDFTPVNNLDWTRDVTVISFLRDVGKYFSMTPLVQRDFIARRMGEGGSGISYTEFSYTLLQGMDFMYLFDTYGVTLEVGSVDQWGNCISGIELIRKARNQDAYVFTHPLIINKATGKKFGKSEDGAVWLDPKRTTPTQFYQFWINADDEGVEEYLKVYTELNKPAVDGIMAEHRKSPQHRHAQHTLAREVTRLVHGESEEHIAEAITKVLVGETPVADLDNQALGAMRSEVASTKTAGNTSLIDLLVETGLASSKGEARKLLAGNAVYVNNDVRVEDALTTGDFHNGRLLLRKGKVLKNSALVELQ